MAIARFWRENDSRYNMYGKKCGNCDKTYFPPRDMCPKCRRESMGKMKKVQLTGKGKVISYSIVHDGLPEFHMQLPYTIAIIELEEGARITGQVVDCNGDSVKIGSKVKSVFRKLGEEGKSGVIHYGYKFKLI
ncbi:MAG: Zn-ribbon domain-containing OB-fold protein [Thermoplasmata archaeon]|nr:Zn-ribbon domain-containing OB-fold protein [Thermoplasmata archaeon]MCK5396887.1 Zn-ribbon domain-containing OB-fold protein [Thermoplasmata archaeon]